MEKIKFYKNGKYESCNEINGIKHGKAIIFFEEGSKEIEEEFYYENGVKNGNSFLLLKDKLEKRSYVNSELQGKAVLYFNDESDKIKEEFYYEKGKKQGEYFLYLEDGIEKGYYINGRKEGLAVKYSLKGEIEESTYSHDFKISEFKSLKDLLGIPYEKTEYEYLSNKLDEDKQNGYKLFIEEAQKKLSQYSYKRIAFDDLLEEFHNEAIENNQEIL